MISEGAEFCLLIFVFVVFVVFLRTPVRGVFVVVVSGDWGIGDGDRYGGSVVAVPSVPCEVGCGGGRRFRWDRWGRPGCRVVRRRREVFGVRLGVFP